MGKGGGGLQERSFIMDEQRKTAGEKRSQWKGHPLSKKDRYSMRKVPV